MRRMHGGRKREVKRGIKRLEKMMKTVSSIRTALQLVICVIPNVQQVMLVLGPSPMRPQHVYEVCFAHGKVVCGRAGDFTKTRTAEGLSRKVKNKDSIRLICIYQICCLSVSYMIKGKNHFFIVLWSIFFNLNSVNTHTVIQRARLVPCLAMSNKPNHL